MIYYHPMHLVGENGDNISTLPAADHTPGLGAILPPDFRGRSLLEVGIADESAGAVISDLIGSQVVHVARVSLADSFEVSDVGPARPSTCPGVYFDQTGQLNAYDLTVIHSSLDSNIDPVKLLRKISFISKFAVVGSHLPANDLDGNQVMSAKVDKPSREGVEGENTISLGRNALRTMIEIEGFDILAENVLTTHGLEYYLAFLKSRNVEIMSPESASRIHSVLVEEFGKDNLVSVGIFGSTTRATDKANSDFDYTLIVNGLSSDIYEREKASPRIKRSLREAGIDVLCAFNIYTPEEFKNADAHKLWLLESMKTGYRIMHDTDSFLAGILGSKQDGVERFDDRFAWSGVEYVDTARFKYVIENHAKAAKLLESFNLDIAACHVRESQRVELIAKLQEHGESVSRGSLYSLAQRLTNHYGESLDLEAYRQAEFDQITEGNQSTYGYGTVGAHLKAAEILDMHDMPLEALSHVAIAARNVYLQALHSKGNYIIDGEVTQLFLKEFSANLSTQLVDNIYESSFKAEQILGRSGFLSFDLDEYGKPIYEDPQTSSFDYKELAAKVREIIKALTSDRALNNLNVDANNKKVSLIISAYNGTVELQDCITGLNKLIFPAGMLELIIATDSSEYDDAIDELRLSGKLPMKVIRQGTGNMGDLKNRSIEASTGEFTAFLDSNMTITPLWLINLLSGFKNDQIAGVETSNHPHPANSLISPEGIGEVAHQPTIDITGQITNIFTGSACVRKEILEKLGGFQGGDKGADLARRIRTAGYSLAYAEGHPTYSKAAIKSTHRSV
jgi:hypothetical protein